MFQSRFGEQRLLSNVKDKDNGNNGHRHRIIV